MAKLPICRICLAVNVRMYIVVNKNLHRLYEKLTDVPFVTADRRPMVACFICYPKLKQCYRLLRQCLEAEKVFPDMMNEDYEPNHIDHLECYGGFVRSAMENISIVDFGQIRSIAMKEQLPDEITELKEEHPKLELENVPNSGLDVAVTLPLLFESDLEDDVPLIEFNTVVEEEQVSKNKRRARETTKLEPGNVQNSGLDVAGTVPLLFESDLEDDVPLIEFNTVVEDEQEVSKNKRRARETTKLELGNVCDVAGTVPLLFESDLEDDVPLIEFNTVVEDEQEVSKIKRRARETIRATVTKKAKLPTRKAKPEATKTAEQTKQGISVSKVIRITEKRICKPSTYFKEPSKCDQRGFKPAKNNIQLSHSQIDGKPYKCDICQQSFSQSSHLRRHIHVHTGLKPYKCDICQRSFSDKGILTQHIQIHTGEKPYQCNVCKRNFSQRGNLTKHIRTHTGEKPFKCNECQHSFSEKCSLANHIRIHTGEKPYKCDVCQRSFVLRGNLTKHIRIHTGEKPYKCDVCQRSFRDKSHITQHMRTHAVEKPYKCDMCQLSFREKSNLRRHISIHTGKKPFKCDVCQRRFYQRYELTNHNRIHTGEKR